jgi:hypothetical protein
MWHRCVVARRLATGQWRLRAGGRRRRLGGPSWDAQLRSQLGEEGGRGGPSYAKS